MTSIDIYNAHLKMKNIHRDLNFNFNSNEKINRKY
jgi:hypothetical protein